jgi:hypothetical protein
MRMRTTRPAAVLVLSLLAGCGSDPAPAAGPPAPSGAPGSAPTSAGDGQPQCPAAADLATLGIAVTANHDPTRSGTTVVVCSFDGTRSSDGNAVSVTLRLQNDASASSFADFRTQSAAQGYQVADRGGVGDEAFTYVFGPTRDPINTLVARKDRLMVYLGTQAPFDQEVAFVNQLFGR